MHWAGVPSEEELNEALLGLTPNEVEAVFKLYGWEMQYRIVTPWPGPHCDDGSYMPTRVSCYIDRDQQVMKVFYG